MSLKYRNFRNSNELIFVRNNHRFSYGSREAIGFHTKNILTSRSKFKGDYA